MTYPSCVRSGFCCRQAPCSAGEVTSDADQSCKFLEVDKELAPGVITYRCGKYEEIVARAGYKLLPMFGSGCSSTLFNEARDKILRALVQEVENERLDPRRNVDGVRRGAGQRAPGAL